MSKGIPCSYPHPGLAIRGVNFSQGPEQDKPLAGRFAGPKKIRGFSESAGLTKVAVKGTGPIRVLNMEKEAGQGGTRRDVFSKSRLFALKKRNIGPFQGTKLTTIFIISNSSRGPTPFFCTGLRRPPADREAVRRLRRLKAGEDRLCLRENCPPGARVMEVERIKKVADWLSTHCTRRKEPESFCTNLRTSSLMSAPNFYQCSS